MKFESQIAYPYPVLRPDSDDYVDAEFQSIVDFTIGEEDRFVTASAKFAISSKEIMDQINKGSAAFFLAIGCRSTYYRVSVFSREKSTEAKIDIENLRDEVRVEPYVVAIKEISRFTSPDINPEFGKGPFRYRKGHILAQDDHQVVYIEKDVFKPISSVFDLIKLDSLSGSEWTLAFEQDHVQIAVSPEMKEKVDSARNTASNKAVLINSIYFAAVMQAIQNLKEGSDFNEYKWAKVIRRKAHNEGIDIMSKQAYDSAERLMKFPLSLLDTYLFRGE